MVENEQVRPLAPAAARAAAAAAASSDEEAAKTRSSSRKLTKRPRLLCFGCCAGTIIILGVVILVLALTVFKVKDPIISVNSVTLDRISFNTTGGFSAPAALNLTLTSDVSIKNPNAASFKFGNSTTSLSYRGKTVGQVHSPAGKARARRTIRLNVTVDVLADQLAGDLNLLSDVANGSLTVNSHTKIGGRVSLLRIIKRHVDVIINCTILVSVSNQAIQDQSCVRKVKM